MKSRFLVFIFIILLVASCNRGQIKQSGPVTTDSVTQISKIDTIVDITNGIPIFYNMYLSVEMSSLFKSINASYNEKLLNSPDRLDRYNISTDKALNLGVYAVDLSYAKYFDQINQAGKYLKSMHQLSNELGIPDDKFMVSLKRIESNISNKDSLIRIANELYKQTQAHLKENERESAAAFIIAGGWVEALYIATNLVSKPEKDIEFIERIKEQKHSLSNLIQLLNKYENEVTVKELLSKLYDLKTNFDKFEIVQNKIDKKQLDEITFKISVLRKDIIY